jgi:hypothetical protein
MFCFLLSTPNYTFCVEPAGGEQKSADVERKNGHVDPFKYVLCPAEQPGEEVVAPGAEQLHHRGVCGLEEGRDELRAGLHLIKLADFVILATAK